MPPTWTIRRATKDDATGVIAVAAAAWRDTYQGLLRRETIEGFIERAYALERVRTRIADDHFYVAVAADGIVAFADAVERDDRLYLVAIYALPAFRGQGAGTSLLEALAERFPNADISADVVVGNRKGEVFYERRGFSPRETMEATLLGDPVVERRWYRPAGATPRTGEASS